MLKDELLSTIAKLEYNSEYSILDLIVECNYYFSKYKKQQESNANINANIKNILITQFNGLGDAILSTGFIESIHEMFPDSKITLVCGENCRPIFELFPYLTVLTAEIKSDAISSIIYDEINFIYDNNLTNFDLAISPNWGMKVRAALLFNFFTGCNLRIGYGDYEPLKQYFEPAFFDKTFGQRLNVDNKLLTHPIIHPFEIMNDLNRKKYLLKQIAHIFNIPYINKPNKLYISDKDEESIEYLLQKGKRIVLCIGGSRKNKQYPLDRWKKVLRKIKHTVYIIGTGQEEYNMAHELLDTKVINLVNDLSVRESIALIKNCHLYIGNDTSMAHVAKIFNLPLIVVSAEAADKLRCHERGLLSYYERFYSTYDNCEFIRPKESLDECKFNFTENGCMKEEAHCIAHISPNKIISAYAFLLSK